MVMKMWKSNRYDKTIRRPHTIIVDEDAWKYLKSEGLNISAFFENLFNEYIEKSIKPTNSDSCQSQESKGPSSTPTTQHMKPRAPEL